MLNVLPAAYFATMIYVLNVCRLSERQGIDFVKIVAVILAAFWAMIGFYRLWYALASWWRECLYSPFELTYYKNELSDLDRGLACGNCLWALVFYLPCSVGLILYVRFW